MLASLHVSRSLAEIAPLGERAERDAAKHLGERRCVEKVLLEGVACHS